VGHAAGDADGRADGPAALTTRSTSLLFAAAFVAAAPPLGAQTWRTLTSARQYHGEDSLAVSVTYAAGEFRLGPGEPGSLYRMELRYDEDRFTPVRVYDPEGPRLTLGVRGPARGVSFASGRGGGPAQSLDVFLSPEVPLRLNLELGAVRSWVDLGGLALRSVRYRTGASETELRFSRPNPERCDLLVLEAGAAGFRAFSIGNANCRQVRFSGGMGEVSLDFSGSWQGEMSADLDVAVGSFTLMLPRDAGIAIRVSRFLASFDKTGFVRRGDTYYSSRYDSARRHLTIGIRAIFGGVDVVWTGDGR